MTGIQSTTTLWPPGTRPLAPPRPRTRQRRSRDRAPVSAKVLAEGLSAAGWREITWRAGEAEPLRPLFVALRIAANRDWKRFVHWPEEWLLIERPEDEAEPTKYWLSNLTEDTPLERLVHLARLRWRIERDYRDRKQDLGLGHYEGRGWRGFHHYPALCIAAYGFLLK